MLWEVSDEDVQKRDIELAKKKTRRKRTNKCKSKNHYKKHFIEPQFKVCYDCRKEYYKKCSRCNKSINSKYKYCFKCNDEVKEEKDDVRCIACNNTGTSYLSDGVFGDCMQCDRKGTLNNFFNQ